MTTRTEQRDETRERILLAAIAAFSDLGYAAAGTRDIARRAGVTQGLITYHFGTKDALWQATADRLFADLAAELAVQLSAAGKPKERAREAIRAYIRFAAHHPELFRLMVDEGRRSDQRMRWLVDHHLRPLYEGLSALLAAAGRDVDVAHLYYAVAGGSMIFALAPECRYLTGIDPQEAHAIDIHAELLARSLVP